jgi:DNA repair exonuclease SbcCD nuclease subunit
MSHPSFRFLHAGEFHLEQPLGGVAETPDHLRDLFLDAPCQAAQRVFDAAIAEDVQFVVLSGDTLNPVHAGPRAILFLTEQLARLAERNVAVYWAGGTVDPPEAWPATIPLPENVRIFPRGRVEEVLHESDGVALARIIGISRDRQRPLKAAEFAADPSGTPTIAVAHGVIDPAAVQSRGICYWALGSRHDRSTPSTNPCIVHYCGTPQGRCPQETGVHGCTLVQVDEHGQAKTSFIPTDAARWLSERLAIDDDTARDDLESHLRERIHGLLESASKVPLLLQWTLAGKGPLAMQLRREHVISSLLESLRSEFGRGQPPAWSVSIDLELTDTVPPEWYEQETIRGDFLRAMRQLQMNSDEPIDLDPYVAESHRAGTLAASVAIADKPARDRALREATLLGIDLLSGEEAQT